MQDMKIGAIIPTLWENKDMDIDYRHVDVIDGIRGVAVLLVLWFHFWQQTWLMPAYPTPFLSFLGINSIDLNPIRYAGYLFVDMMVLISAFCLGLPLARTMLLGEKMEDSASFFKKRFARIYPAYAAAVLISFFWVLGQGKYPNASLAVRDLLSHLTFTCMFRMDTYIFAPINGVLWTVSLEVQFYLLFPLIRKLFKRWSGAVYLSLMGMGIAFIYLYALKHQPTSMVVNQLPAFFPVFANGLLGAYLFTLYTTRCRIKRLLGPVFALISLVFVYVIARMVIDCYRFPQDRQLWQLQNRIPLSFAYLGVILSSAMASKPLRWLLSNRLMSFLGSISFGLYLCHQRLMVYLVQAMGFNNGADVSAAGKRIQWLLTLEGLALSLLIATVITYLIEKPCRKRLLKGRIHHEQLSI